MVFVFNNTTWNLKDTLRCLIVVSKKRNQNILVDKIYCLKKGSRSFKYWSAKQFFLILDVGKLGAFHYLKLYFFDRNFLYVLLVSALWFLGSSISWWSGRWNRAPLSKTEKNEKYFQKSNQMKQKCSHRNIQNLLPQF